MKPNIFKIGRWILFVTGNCLLTFNNSKTNVVFPYSYDSNIYWKPWSTSKFGIFIGIFHIFVLVLSEGQRILRFFRTNDFSLNRTFINAHFYEIEAIFRVLFVIYVNLLTVIKRREITQLLNDISSFYFAVWKSTDPPKFKKFTYLYFRCIVSFIPILGEIISTRNTLNLGYLLHLYYHLTTFTMTLAFDFILISIQLTMAESNIKIKKKIPSVYKLDFESWELSSKKRIYYDRKNLENVRLFLEERRRTYREFVKIVQQINSIYGYLNLILLIWNQVPCIIMGYRLYSTLLTYIKIWNYKDHDSEIEKKLLYGLLILIIRCLKVALIYHGFGVVAKEAEETRSYISLIDTSQIDKESKLELLDFLEEIDYNKVQFMAGNAFPLTTFTMISVLNRTITYASVIIQYVYV